jgi:hypothetical protein
MAVFVLPGSTTFVSVRRPAPGAVYDLTAPTGTTLPVDGTRWRFAAPDAPGLYPLVVTEGATEHSIQFQVFVLTPWNRRGRTLEGYRIGRYQPAADRGQARYAPPEGFVEVTAANRDVRVSPHFRLEQFLCKQTDDLPQFALVRTRLLQALERILTAVREAGPAVSTLHVMSGFRTPYYNRAIGNTTEYSRHLYGDAADIFVDANGDERMDDLTGDGRVTRADARRLAAIVRTTLAGPNATFVGGLGIYGPAPHRGPFVHVDLRGTRARW